MSSGIDVEVRNLRKVYGDRAVVDGIGFRLEPGTVTGFVGPNGSGKTTALKLMLGLVSGEGSTLFAGRSLRELDAPQSLVGAMFDGRVGDPRVVVARHLQALSRMTSLPDRRVAEVLDQVGLSSSSLERLDTLSLGMTQRLNVAAAMLAAPSVLIVDEPTNGLDPEGVLMVRGAIRQCADNGGTVLFSSHLLAEVEAISDRFMIISAGALVADALAVDFQRVYGESRVILRVERGDGLTAVLDSLGYSYEVLGEAHCAVTGVAARDLGPQLFRSDIAVCELRDECQTLEALFFRMTAAPGREMADA
jgi:ABC-2 type transport system ATP-binding protein